MNVGKYKFQTRRFLNGKLEINTILASGFNDYETIMDFDFTVCCCSISKDRLIYHKDYLQHIKEKKIILNNTDRMDHSIIEKYRYKGYSYKYPEIDSNVFNTFNYDINDLGTTTLSNCNFNYVVTNAMPFV